MLRNLLCCVDGSRHSESGLRHAVNLAARSAGRVELLHVVADTATADDELLQMPSLLVAESPPDVPEELPPPGEGVNRPEQMLGRMVEICRGAQVGWTISSLPGEPVDRILQRGRVADIVVIGRQGADRAGREPRIGSVTRRVIARAEQPLLVATGTFTEPHTVLVPYARTREAGRALRLAAEIVTHLDASLVVMAATEDSVKAEQALGEAEEYLRAYRLEVSLIHRKDSVQQAAPVVCSEQECELIVMGALGTGVFDRGLAGLPTSAVLRATRCPVLLCP